MKAKRVSTPISKTPVTKPAEVSASLDDGKVYYVVCRLHPWSDMRVHIGGFNMEVPPPEMSKGVAKSCAFLEVFDDPEKAKAVADGAPVLPITVYKPVKVSG